jgi:radical SAM superfamily enzyme YgiQ (UPF0313 family)
VRVVLVSTYDLGRQPFGLASPAAWLRAAGHEVRCLDLAVEPPDEEALRRADVIAFHLPMHTATRSTARLLPRIREINPNARMCAFGLYAAGHADRLRPLGVDAAFGGEYESALAEWVAEGGPRRDRRVDLDRLEFQVPDRSDLPGLDRYARLQLPDGSQRIVGATEASRGCKHRCRHCPIVPVYGGRFRIVAADVVLEDVRRLVAAGAEHITFGDPDFWNGIGHAMPLVRRLHAEHPRLSYDVTIKIEHLLRHRAHLAELRETGCRLVTSAVESLDDDVLARLDKGHTRADVRAALALCREHDLPLRPTFVPFTPWTTLASHRDLLETLAAWGLIEHVEPVQLTIRLLITAGSRLLELDDVRALVGAYDEDALVYPWRHSDSGVDRLQRELFQLVSERVRAGMPRGELVREVCRRSGVASHERTPRPHAAGFRLAPMPYLTEPWYC